ncbi:zinc finger and cchc domain-containing protein, putative [Pediculus humanus corporis]|uniref:Zinc finger and cchc domain-containing protein, putative n=1 Tax=Pediculus humanus subsp. corporis TaxID=121224 RepID=E0VSW0_PEDHC|nr:zinc finger and cchc domain-containing protein, putative [Pediculus humanus corporis]EEB16466.1 zinc finger and cchc domain-containing protein, putative [Pediculus humanus corporis]
MDDMKSLDDRVLDSINEFQKSVLKLRFLEVNERDLLNMIKIIDETHFFCIYCNKHYYVLSSICDKNSLFQNHINSSYHRSCGLINPIEFSKILSWEKFGLTAYCNVCNISDINAIVFNTGLTVDNLIKCHECTQIELIKIESLYRNLAIIKLFSCLEIFLNAFFDKDKNANCLLCLNGMNSSMHEMKKHVVSDVHTKNFLEIIKMLFDFQFNDLLNGYNLEKIISYFIENNFTLKSIKNIEYPLGKDVKEMDTKILKGEADVMNCKKLLTDTNNINNSLEKNSVSNHKFDSTINVKKKNFVSGKKKLNGVVKENFKNGDSSDDQKSKNKKEITVPGVTVLEVTGKKDVKLIKERNAMKNLMDELILKSSSEKFIIKNRKKENILLGKMEEALNEIYPNIALKIFGSRATGLYYDSNSDADIYLSNLYNEKEVIPTRRFLNVTLKKMRRVFKSKRRQFTKICPVRKAIVPILILTEISTGLQCDISFKNGLSVNNSRLIKFFTSLDERVKPIMLFVKYWIKDYGKKSILSSFALTLMVVFYLQRLSQPILPTVDELEKKFVGKRNTVAGWNCDFDDNIVNYVYRIKNSNSVLDLIKGFFEFYIHFNYDEYVISPLDGKLISRISFYSESMNVPLSYKKQFHNMQLSKLKTLFTSPMCILDPLNFSYNAGSSVSSRGKIEFILLCTEALYYLEKNNDLNYCLNVNIVDKKE